MTDGTLLYWPPLPADDPLLGLVPSLSWFFGDWYDTILIPVSGSSPPKRDSGSSLAGAHALANVSKIWLVSAKDQKVLEARASGADRLIWTEDLPDEFIDGPGKPMPGSRSIDRLKGQSQRYQYYFVGDPRRDPQEAFFKATFSYWRQGGEDSSLLLQSRQRLVELKNRLPSGAQTNLFGTGPSLSEIEDQDFSADINIVCNSILKDHVWIKRNAPLIIVAADAHFHFSYHKYAERFLQDLKFALSVLPHASYVTFDKFAALLLKKFPGWRRRIIALPASRKSYGVDLDREFALFPGDSVVNLFMMPIATFLGRDIAMSGFTGRGPADKFFWGHSERFQYSDHMEIVRQAHPAFFDRDFSGYNTKVDEDLDVRVETARAAGLRVMSRTTTYYKCLASESER